MRLHTFALLALALVTLADFHVGLTTWAPLASPYSIAFEWVACPSNYYNCNCFGPAHDRVAYVSGGKPTGDFFRTEGLCGTGRLNFYKRDDGHWEFYKDGGDGTVQGKCYSNKASWDGICAAATISYADSMVCYSYICNP